MGFKTYPLRRGDEPQRMYEVSQSLLELSAIGGAGPICTYSTSATYLIRYIYNCRHAHHPIRLRTIRSFDFRGFLYVYFAGHCVLLFALR
jgi:hypothetical protein